MTEEQYFGDNSTNIEEKSVEEIREECYKDFMETLNHVIDMISIYPSNWHLKLLKGIMEDI